MLRQILNYFQGKHQARTALPCMQDNNALARAMNQDQALDAYVYTVVDTELTGLSARKEEIVSLAAVRVQGLRIVPGEFVYTLVRPAIPLPKISTLIHRLTPELLVDAPALHEVLPEFIEFCRGTLLVGHHIGLDMRFINRACQRLYGQRLANPCLDTMRMAMLWRDRNRSSQYEQFDTRISYTLADLAEEFGLPRFPAHNALGDALQTAYLFIYLARKTARTTPLTLRELYRAGQRWRWYV